MKYIVDILTLLLLMFSIVSCSEDDRLGISDDAGEDGVYINVTISIGGNRSATRATATPGTDPATDNISVRDGSFAENYIDPDDVRLFVYDQAGKFVDEFTIIYTGHGSNTGNVTAPQESPYQCFVQGYLTDLTEAYYHIVAVCNTGGELTGSYTPTEGDPLSELISGFTYGTYSATFTERLLANASSAANSTRIPMWGICTTKLRKGYSADAPIAVLRSMAKVIVKFDAGSSYTLNSVTLTHANPQGTLAAGGTQAYTPGSISETTENAEGESVTATYTTYTTAWNTETETPITSPNIPTGIETVHTGLPFKNTTEGYVIYVPEYRNMDMATVTGDDGTVTTATPAADYASMKLNITGNGIAKEYTLHFAEYTSDSDENPTAPAWDIIRNDIYEYTVTGVKENGGLNARVRVMPWEYETMEYELSQEAEVVLLSEPQAVNNANTNNEYANEVAYSLNDADTTNYATFLIRVDEPKGVRWVAHLTNPYYFTFTSGSQTSGFGGSGETVSITVKPRDAKGVGSSTQLFFTIETLLDSVANISPSRSDLASELREHYAIRYGSRIDITQVEAKSKVNNGVVPFVVTDYLGSATTGTVGGKTGVQTYSSLSTIGETVRVFDADAEPIFTSALAEKEITIDDDYLKWSSAGAGEKTSQSIDITTVYDGIGTAVAAGSTVFGDSYIKAAYYADLTGYATMTIKGTANAPLRILLNRLEDNGPMIELNPTIGSDGTVTIGLAGYEFVHLHAIKLPKSADGGIATTIESITLNEDGVTTDYNLFSNGAVMAAYNNKLYCMWQTSKRAEDTPDTYVAYSTSSDGGVTWDAPKMLCPTIKGGYCSSGGWMVNNSGQLVAYINTWVAGDAWGNGAGGANEYVTANSQYYYYKNWSTATGKPSYGKTRYMTTTDGTTWSAPADLGMEGGNAIFEQDPHVIELKSGGKRIINAAHFQSIGSYTNGLYVNPIYADYTDDGITGWKQAGFSFTELNGTQSREMEPSMFRKANGSLVMIFRDNKPKSDGTYTHRVRASISTDEGLTWSAPVETGLMDSKSKQCAGNLPDGTAFIVNNPVENETRSPLVIHLSKDGETFTKAYLLRTGESKSDESESGAGIQPKSSTAAGTGYSYPKAMVAGDYLYVSYSTHKQDVEYTRIPLSSIQLNDPSAR